MYIAYQSSDEFAVHTGVSVFSLLKNNQDMNEITIFLLSNGISKKEIEKIKKTVYDFKREIIIIDINKRLSEIKSEFDLELFKNNLTACVEMLPTEIFPEYIDEVLLIDSDTVITGSISDIRSTDFYDYIISVVPNYQFNHDYEDVSRELQHIIKKNGFYYNTGVVMYNLKKWRELACNKFIMKSIKELTEINYFATQTIVNNAIPIEFVKKMKYKYNYFGFLYPNKLRESIHKLYGDEASEAENDPIILHYKGFFSRPWFKEVNDEYCGYYRKYKKDTLWNDVPLVSIYDSSGFKSLSVFIKIKYIIKRFVAKSIMKIQGGNK